MKNFNIIIIACFVFIFLSSSGCSKEEEEESPYKPEQIIGRWYTKSYCIEDKYGNEYWKDEPKFGEVYDQFNADGTFYVEKMESDKSSWSLNIKNIHIKRYRGDGTFSINTYEIDELTEKTLILNRHLLSPNISKIKYINEKFMNFKYTTDDVVGKWIYQSEFKDGTWIDYPNFGYYYNEFRKDGRFLTQHDTSPENSWFIDNNTIFCKIVKSSNSTENISYKIESIKNGTMIVIKEIDGKKLRYVKE